MKTRKPFSILFTWFLIWALISVACGLGTGTPAVSPATLAAATVQAVLDKAATDTAATATAAASMATNTPEPLAETNTPSPTNTLAPSNTPEVNAAIAVSFGGASFNVPAGLASQAKSELAPSVPFNSDSPFDMGSPAALKFTFDGYPVSNSLFSPVISIMPISLFNRINSRGVDTFAAMGKFIDSGTLAGTDVPFLPYFNAAQIFHAQLKILPSLAGKGYRFVTKYGQDASPLANDAIFYTYQGLSSDGQYFITAILPVHATILPASFSDTIIPAGGVTPPDLNDPNYGTKYAGYIQQVSMALDGLSGDKFTPTLDQLDQMVSSIALSGVSGLIPACPGLLTVGTKAYVSLDPPVSNNLRSGPAKSEKVVDTIAPGTVIEILNGPTCADGLIYWQVRVPSKSNLTAYTAESDMKEQWLLPCPTSGSCP